MNDTLGRYPYCLIQIKCFKCDIIFCNVNEKMTYFMFLDSCFVAVMPVKSSNKCKIVVVYLYLSNKLFDTKKYIRFKIYTCVANCLKCCYLISANNCMQIFNRIIYTSNTSSTYIVLKFEHLNIWI